MVIGFLSKERRDRRSSRAFSSGASGNGFKCGFKSSRGMRGYALKYIVFHSSGHVEESAGGSVNFLFPAENTGQLA
jgi:hypothetical protein